MIIKNKKKIILITLLLIIIVSITLIILNKTGVINKIIQNNSREEIKKEISYEVYHHVEGDTKILIVAEDTENGIEKIIYPNNEMELYCNGKTKVAFDYNTDITGKESLTFKAINTLGEEIEKTIAINEQFYLDMIDNSITTETETQKVLAVNYKEGSVTRQYRIGDTSNWVNYTNTIRLDDYQILETLGDENRKVNVGLRQVDNLGYEIITQREITIPNNIIYKQEDTVIEGESILACVENNNLETGNYIFRVTGTVNGGTAETIEYPVELYNYNEDANYIGENYTIVGNTAYIGMGKSNSEKRMLILKYNKNLTVNEGVEITPTGTSASINGATYLCTKKGMFIYCVGTLTNNGSITMTAKGTVNQEGENVYLYKNEDNTYEYVPAVGGNGATAVSGNSKGINGSVGTVRGTGGGGSGAVDSTVASYGTSGAGSTGTSYSGGTGGSGKWHSSGTSSGGSGSPNGGAGGSGTYEGYVAYSSGGGAGNPGGTAGNTHTGIRDGASGETGTGGLLIIDTNILKNNGIISSNGSIGGYGRTVSGGGSGGGSINLFCKSNIEIGTILTSGGTGGAVGTRPNERHSRGGAGGDGSITIGNISTGTFVKDE